MFRGQLERGCLRDVDCNVVNLSFVAKCNFPQAFVMATLSKNRIYKAKKSIQSFQNLFKLFHSKHIQLRDEISAGSREDVQVKIGIDFSLIHLWWTINNSVIEQELCLVNCNC